MFRKARVAIDQAKANCYADQVSSACRSELRLDAAATVCCGLVANTHRVGDLGQGAAFGQLAQDLEIARG
jgi:hypothetical protein